MKFLSVMLAVGCWLSSVSAQWLETTINLPDSSYPCALGYNSQNNKVYCVNAGSSSVTVIDGATNAIITTIPVSDTSGLDAICYNPQNNKLYCSNRYSNNVTVIDGATNGVITTVPVGNEPIALCYNPQNNKVYCASGGWFLTGPDSTGTDSTVTVIDGASNSIVATVVTPGHPHALCYNPHDNKVYSGNSGSGDENTVTIIDGATNGIITNVSVGLWPEAFCYNAQNNKVYCSSNTHVLPAPFYVTVIDGTTNGIITTDTVGLWPVFTCYNLQNNKVYYSNNISNDVSVIDGATNAVIATVAVDVGPCPLCYNPQNDKVYVANGGWRFTYHDSTRTDSTVTVIDGATDEVITTIEVGLSPVALAYNPVQNRVYVANFGSASVSVIRDSVLGIEEREPPTELSRQFTATVVRGVLRLPAASGVQRGAGSILLDISGRTVMELNPGPNDVSRLAPGVYFLRVGSHQTAPARKIVIEH